MLNILFKHVTFSQAWKNWHEGTTTNLIDPALGASSTSLQDIVRCLHIGLLCVQESAADRPTMAMLVVMLSNFSLNLPTPSQPAFFMSSPDISSSTIEGSENLQIMPQLVSNIIGN